MCVSMCIGAGGRGGSPWFSSGVPQSLCLERVKKHYLGHTAHTKRSVWVGGGICVAVWGLDNTKGAASSQRWKSF